MLTILSVISLFFVFRYYQEKNLSSKTLSEKEILIASLKTEVENLLKANEKVQSEDARKELKLINDTLEKYETVKEKTASYKKDGVGVGTIESQLPKAVDLIISKKYSEADSLLSKLDSDLESALKTKQTATASPPVYSPSPSTGSSTCSQVPTIGYCRMNIKASSGTFSVDIVAAQLSNTKVVTLTANSNNCTNNCPTKSLASFIGENGGFAGINGTYFCPPDYASCAGKVNSYDMPIYSTTLKKWLNQDKLPWFNRAMFAFAGSTPYFYQQTYQYGSLGGLTAAIANFPGLVYNGGKIVGNYTLTSAQNTKGNRGGIATKGGTVYLVVARSASVSDLANIMIAMGVTHGLNLDGGGSSALYYNGSYKVGPGRSLPNAVILRY